jgi:drug/metabolite transporter (DMT)-like permease
MYGGAQAACVRIGSDRRPPNHAANGLDRGTGFELKRRMDHQIAMDRYLFIGLTLALTVYGQLVMKSRALSATSSGDGSKLHYLVTMFTDALVLSALASGVLAAVCWMLALERTDIGFAYPFMALSFVLVPLAAAFFFEEPVSLGQMAGLFMIVAGVTVSATLR